MERARSEWLRALGFEQDQLVRTDGVLFAVSAANIRFQKPARFNDLLDVTVTLDRLGAASLNLLQEVRRDASVLASAEVRIACLDVQRFVPVAIPAQVAGKLAAVNGAAPPRVRPLPKVN